MRHVASLHVWARLPIKERDAVAEAIVRVLTEEVESERFSEGATHPSVPSGCYLHPPIRSQTGPTEPREWRQSASTSRTSSRASALSKLNVLVLGSKIPRLQATTSSTSAQAWSSKLADDLDDRLAGEDYGVFGVS